MVPGRSGGGAPVSFRDTRMSGMSGSPPPRNPGCGAGSCRRSRAWGRWRCCGGVAERSQPTDEAPHALRSSRRSCRQFADPVGSSQILSAVACPDGAGPDSSHTPSRVALDSGCRGLDPPLSVGPTWNPPYATRDGIWVWILGYGHGEWRMGETGPGRCGNPATATGSGVREKPGRDDGGGPARPAPGAAARAYRPFDRFGA